MKRLHYFFVNACLAMLGRAALHAPLASAQTPSQHLAMAQGKPGSFLAMCCKSVGDIPGQC
jgi:hypothetical protein